MALKMINLDSQFDTAWVREVVAAKSAMALKNVTGKVSGYVPFRLALADIKDARPSLSEPALPSVFRDFYEYARRELEFDTTPDYKRWIAAMTEYANTP